MDKMIYIGRGAMKIINRVTRDRIEYDFVFTFG